MTTTITDLDDPRIADYRNVSEPALLRTQGLFVAEGRLVVGRLLEDGRFPMRSVLTTPAALTDLEGGDGESSRVSSLKVPAVSVFVVSPELMRRVTGFNFHRGCLALAERPAPVAPAALLARVAGPGVIVVLEEVANADNVGSVFRNALAFGARAVLLSPGCCDPLYRKAIRTSMAASLRVPYARIEPWPEGLASVHEAGFRLIALAPGAAADLRVFAGSSDLPPRIALLVGTEGDGVSAAALARADASVRIPMQAGVDSLNLATAAGIALYSLSSPRS